MSTYRSPRPLIAVLALAVFGLGVLVGSWLSRSSEASSATRKIVSLLRIKQDERITNGRVGNLMIIAPEGWFAKQEEGIVAVERRDGTARIVFGPSFELADRNSPFENDGIGAAFVRDALNGDVVAYYNVKVDAEGECVITGFVLCNKIMTRFEGRYPENLKFYREVSEVLLRIRELI